MQTLSGVGKIHADVVWCCLFNVVRFRYNTWKRCSGVGKTRGDAVRCCLTLNNVALVLVKHVETLYGVV